MTSGRTWLVIAVVLFASAGLAGCVSSQQAAQIAATATGCTEAKGGQTTTRSFQYGSFVKCKTATESYDWSNPSGAARVQLGSGLTSGALTVTVRDAMDRVVFQQTNDAGGSGMQTRTDPGVPSNPFTGTWTVELEFENVTGALGVQITASPATPTQAPVDEPGLVLPT